MYVCVCHAVTDRQIRECVDRGARSLFDVQCRLPVGGCCGSCQEAAKQVVDEHLTANLNSRARSTAA
jgi:bacterioferritin-associated ferredoxin